MLESVQIRTINLADGLGTLHYSERLKKLELPNLVYRRARGDMIEVYKHLHIYDQDTTPKHFRLHNRGSRRHEYRLVWNNSKDGVRGLQANSFYYRTIKNWNELPGVEFGSCVNIFSVSNFFLVCPEFVAGRNILGVWNIFLACVCLCSCAAVHYIYIYIYIYTHAYITTI